MDDPQIPVQEPEDPLAGWKITSSLLLSLLITLFCCSGDGKMVYHTLLIFFPVKCILDGILDNRLRKVVCGLVMLLIYPILLNSIPLLDGQIARWFQGKKVSDTELKVASGILFTGIFFAAMILVSLGSKAVPKWEIPAKIHSCCLAGIFVFSLAAVLIGVYSGLAYCNGRYLRLPAGLNLLLPVILAVFGFIAGIRIIRHTLNPPVKKTESESDPLLAARPKTKLSDVAGMDEVKEQIRLRLIEPLRHPAQAKKYGLKTGGGVLLYGPPGTGKTFLARAVAGELNLPFYMITAADIFGKYVGESEKRIRELFRLARKNPLSVIFIDELETIFSKRSDNIHETTRKVISYILQELDGVDQNKNPILLLGATNTPWLIDEAFLRPGRFDILAFVDLPDQPARVQILQSAFKHSTLPQESGLIQYMAENTAGYSGADLNGVVSKIQQQAFRRGDQSFTKMLAYEVLLKSPPSPNQEMIARLHRWEASRQGRG